MATGKRQFDTTSSHWEGEFFSQHARRRAAHRDIEKERAADLPKYPMSATAAARRGPPPAIDTENGLLYFGTGKPVAPRWTAPWPGATTCTRCRWCLDRSGPAGNHQQVPHNGATTYEPSGVVRLPHQASWKAGGGSGSWRPVGTQHPQPPTGELLKKSDEFVEHHNTFTKPTPKRQVTARRAGINWSPTSVGCEKLVVYVPAIHWPVKYTKRVIPATSAAALEQPPRWSRWLDAPLACCRNIDLASGKMNTAGQDGPAAGGVLATAGNLVFVTWGGQRPLQRLRRRHRPDRCGSDPAGVRRASDAARHLADRRSTGDVYGNQIFGWP